MDMDVDGAVDRGLVLDHRRRTRLYCMNGGHHLQILPDGTVQGQRDGEDVHERTFPDPSVNEKFKVIQNPGFPPDHPQKHNLLGGAVLQLKAVDRGVVVIKGTETGRYLAMNNEGRLYSSPTVNDECYFLEKLEENHYNTYQPQKYKEMNWYVGLKKNGKPKLGPRTHIGQKAVFFLPRQLEHSGD